MGAPRAARIPRNQGMPGRCRQRPLEKKEAVSGRPPWRALRVGRDPAGRRPPRVRRPTTRRRGLAGERPFPATRACKNRANFSPRRRINDLARFRGQKTAHERRRRALDIPQTGYVHAMDAHWTYPKRAMSTTGTRFGHTSNGLCPRHRVSCRLHTETKNQRPGEMRRSAWPSQPAPCPRNNRGSK